MSKPMVSLSISYMTLKELQKSMGHTLRLCLKDGMQLYSYLYFVSIMSQEEKICKIQQIIRVVPKNKFLKYVNYFSQEQFYFGKKRSKN